MAGIRIEVTLPKEIYEKVEDISAEKRVRKSEVVTEAIKEYIDNLEKKKIEE